MFKEFIDMLDSLGAKIGLGTAIAAIFGIFKINSGLDKRIDKRSADQAQGIVDGQREECNSHMWDVTKRGIEESAKIKTIEEKVDAVGKDVKTLLNLHLKD